MIVPSRSRTLRSLMTVPAGAASASRTRDRSID